MKPLTPQNKTNSTGNTNVKKTIRKRRCLFLVCGVLIGLFLSHEGAKAEIDLGAAAPYTLLYEGSGLLRFDASSETGNVGLRAGASMSLNPTSTVDGNVDFAGVTKISGGNQVKGSINGIASAVTDAINDINLLSRTMAALTGNPLAINLPGDQTINASSGHKTGDDYVFDITSFKFDGGKTLTINGDNLDGNVIFNFHCIDRANFNGTVLLTGGLCAADVLWNFSGDGTSIGNKGNANLQGIFLDPNGSISFGGNAELCGRLFGGAGDDLKFIGGSKLQICECPEPSSYLLMGVGGLALVWMCRRKA